MVLIAPQASQAAAWSLQTTPNATADHSALYDISCEPLSTNTCVSVGKKTTGSTGTPYAQLWSGGTWTSQSPVAPVGANSSELQADDCLSSTSCVAVGHSTTGASTVTLAELWNGTSWSTMATPNPVGATETRLRDVSCWASLNCMAVGYQGSGASTSAVALNRTSSWSLVSVPVPAGATATELDGIDCLSATSCVAVGRYTVSGGAYWAMSATWNGTAWSLQTVPSPGGATRSVLLDVACSDASSCSGVGGYTSGGVQRTFVARWDGTTWTQQSSPNPGGSSNSVLQDVACQDASECVAVGDWLNAGQWQPMALAWNGSTWSLESAPNPAGATFGLLEGVACRIDCLAVGWYTDAAGDDKTLGAARPAPAWTQLSLHTPLTLESLSGIACTVASTCFSVGAGGGIARVYSGPGSWALRDSPRPAGAVDSQLRDASCVTGPYLCVAVGTYAVSGGTEMPYAARDTIGSGAWTVGTVATPGGASAALNDVSCSSSTACTAVGDYKNGSVPSTFATRWNGSAWSTQSTPNIVGATTNILTSVSCAASNACMAAGFVTTSPVTSQPIVERWDGTSWTVQTAPQPSGGTNGRLRGVSCASATSCVAVGVSSNKTYAARWDGTTWTASWGPQPRFAPVSAFEDVACTSATACVAVGRYSSSGGTDYSLAADWDGVSWKLHKTPNPSGTLGRVFLGVACPASATCRAVGYSGVSGGTVDLAATWP